MAGSISFMAIATKLTVRGAKDALPGMWAKSRICFSTSSMEQDLEMDVDALSVSELDGGPVKFSDLERPVRLRVTIEAVD